AVALEVVALTLRDRRSRARTSGRRRKSSDLGIGKRAGEHQSPKADTGSPVSVGTVCEILSVRVRAHRQTHREHRALARLARHGPRRRAFAGDGKAELGAAVSPRARVRPPTLTSTSNAESHSRSGSRSPAFASSMIRAWTH